TSIYSTPATRSMPFGGDRAMLRDRKFADSPLEGRVRCELVSELKFRSSQKSGFQRFWDDSDVVRRGFARKSTREDDLSPRSAGRASGLIFLPSIKGRSQQLAWLIAMRKKFSLASRAVGLLYSYNCVTNRSLSVETNFPSRSLDCLTEAHPVVPG